MRSFHAADGNTWNIDVKLPSHSSAMVVFQHADGQSAAGDRYAWINAPVAVTSDPRERLKAGSLLDAMTEADIAKLYRRSMRVKHG